MTASIIDVAGRTFDYILIGESLSLQVIHSKANIVNLGGGVNIRSPSA